MPMKQKLCYYLLFAVLLSVSACTDHNGGAPALTPGADTLYTEPKAMSIFCNEPERALLLIDSACIVGNVSEQRALYLKAVTYYSGMNNFQQAGELCRQLIDQAERKGEKVDTATLADTWTLLGSIARNNSNQAEMIRCNREASRLAHMAGLKDLAAMASASIASALAQQGQIDEAIASLKATIDEMKDDHTFQGGIQGYYKACSSLIYIYFDNARYDDAVNLSQQVLQRIDEFKEQPERYTGMIKGFNPDEYIDFVRGQTLAYIVVARAQQANAVENGVMTASTSAAALLAEARRWEAEMRRTQWSQTIDCDRLMVTAYSDMGDWQRFDEVMARVEAVEQDTISVNYLILLDLRSNAASQRGRTAEALALLRRAYIIKDSLNQRNIDEQLAQQATLYHLQEEQLARQDAESDARFFRWMSAAIVLILAIALAFALYFFYKRRQTMKKNRVLVHEITEAIKYKEMWEAHHSAHEGKAPPSPPEGTAPPSPPEGGTIDSALHTANKTIEAPSGAVGGALGASPSSDVALYQQLRDAILREQLYLDPRLDRQALVDRFGLSKERIGAAFAKGSPFKSLIDFLTDCRLPYAAKLLAEQPELSVADVARQSGFPSADTFGRNFKQRYALTPSQFRENNGR